MPTTIAFCLPGAAFSGRFLLCWTNLVAWFLTNRIRPVLSQHSSCNIYYVRNMCLGADVLRGAQQKPFNGTLAYDYVMWIDSDMVFTPEQFARLLSHEADVVSGVYLMEGGRQFATVRDWDEEFFVKYGTFSFLPPSDIGDADKLLEVAYLGMLLISPWRM